MISATASAAPAGRALCCGTGACRGELMSKDGFDVFSIAHRETARSALAAAFGSAPVGAITAMTGGATTASVYRVEVGQRRYLLRIEGEPSPLRNPHQYVSMRIATEAGIAPAIRYLDEAARIVVIDFIEHQPLKTYPGGPRALAQALGELFSRLQATSVFPLLRQLWRHRRAPVCACAADRPVCRRPA